MVVNFFEDEKVKRIDFKIALWLQILSTLAVLLVFYFRFLPIFLSKTNLIFSVVILVACIVIIFGLADIILPNTIIFDKPTQTYKITRQRYFLWLFPIFPSTIEIKEKLQKLTTEYVSMYKPAKRYWFHLQFDTKKIPFSLTSIPFRFYLYKNTLTEEEIKKMSNFFGVGTEFKD